MAFHRDGLASLFEYFLLLLCTTYCNNFLNFWKYHERGVENWDVKLFHISLGIQNNSYFIHRLIYSFRCNMQHDVCKQAPALYSTLST